MGAAAPSAQNGARATRRCSVSTPPAQQQAPSHAAAYVSWGVGLVGVGVAAFGLIALKDNDTI